MVLWNKDIGLNWLDKLKFGRRRFVTDFSLNEMLDMQKRLQDKYKDKWEKLSPETGKTVCFG